ncbi:MAG: Asp-tRNA(Asn)/Glu-tRNA(Gln) amidotransferase subunit GatA [Candidatus Aminicenantes bacterium]|jgi:aspartyl-tRNA(Asn)/glutamyl-tRNA(Gln) amidotransferase subunit A|nr:Asp-tRNA(Asn)/Glu-tRNA(Gln) amidotransferase subunit GatA [Candidatus Aminicenantes bacterium]
MGKKLFEAGLVEAIELVKKGEVRITEIVEDYISRIEEKDQKIKAYLTCTFDQALSRAREIEVKKEKGRLAGAVIAIKDNIVTKGIRTTCGSKILENFIPPYSATVIERLEAEDAIIIGKTNLDEFAMGSSTENSAFFPTRNPWDIGRVPGGSSGGSAAAVAAMEAAAALGSDTGGSVRQPAAFCGVVGLKPTYGRVSRYGLIAFASSLDQIGPITRSVEDGALLAEIISGFDPKDSTSSPAPVAPYLAGLKDFSSEIKVGILNEESLKGVNPEIISNYQNIIKLLDSLGIKWIKMDFPSWDYALPCYYVIAPAEASSNLARYDGVRYGFRAESRELSEMYLKTRTQGFGSEVKRRILLGTFTLSSGYYEAYYAKAAKARQAINKEFEASFKKIDFILTPTTPEPAFRFGEKQDPLSMYLQDYFTVTANLAGIPGISIPSGFTSEGLPLGIQLLGKAFSESELFKFAFLLEKNLNLKNNSSEINSLGRRKNEK